MTGLATIAGLTAIQCVAVIAVFRSKSLSQARCLIAINMILIAIFAPKLIEIGGFTTNLGNIFYAGVALVQAIIYKGFGKHEAAKTVRMVLFLVTFYTMSAHLLSLAPTVSSDALTEAVNLLASMKGSIVAASFIAFLFGQFVYINLFDYLKFRVPYKYLTAMVALQVVDSLVFFPIAFGNSWNWTEIMLTGLVFKIILGVLFTPCYIICLKLVKHGKQT